MGGYRHEFGSLLEVATLDQVTQHPLAELVLHLVAAHHGHARPGFAERAFDRGFSLDENRAAAREAALRFVRLQREYGWWTLAYLEALLKAADAMGSVETPQC
jgi:CRISPR-associated endonuclease/helicase Cas3